MYRCASYVKGGDLLATPRKNGFKGGGANTKKWLVERTSVS